jgi:serine/threonine-protein kinase
MRPQDPFIGRDILNGQYQILQKIGSGGMGAVYKALETEMNRMVGVKILHPKLANRKDLVSRFRREARAMSQLTHPNTTKVFMFGELEDGSLYIIMEFLDGKNLNQSVRAEGPFAMERALPILIAVCGALDEAHKAGIIHRDLKPENIFLCQSAGLRDYPKVLDFGLAKVGERQMRPGSVILTQEGMVFGTPEFMSPEQAQGKALTPASDTYSLAVILYEVLTGKLPFDAKSAMDFIQLHVTGKPVPLSQRVPGRTFPPLLDQIMDRALGKKAEERYATAADFAQAMQLVLQGATQLPPHLALQRSNEIPTTPAVPVPQQVAEAGRRQQAQNQQQYAQGQQPHARGQPQYSQNPQQRPMMQNGPAVAMPMGHPQTPMSPRSIPAGVPRANIGVLIAVAIAFLLLGVAIAVLLMKFVMR